MNKITADGRIVADAEVRFTPAGDPVCQFRLASDVGFGDRKTTNWFSCSVWGKRGESVAPFLLKGTPVTAYGTLTMREWTNRDGIKQLSPDIRIDEVTLHGKREGSQGSAQAGPGEKVARAAYAPPSSSGGGFVDFEDDIPFAPMGGRKAHYL